MVCFGLPTAPAAAAAGVVMIPPGLPATVAVPFLSQSRGVTIAFQLAASLNVIAMGGPKQNAGAHLHTLLVVNALSHESLGFAFHGSLL